MDEYRIVVRNGKGTPYSLWTFNSFGACYAKLIELTTEHSHSVNNEYYVLNDFWDNKYKPFQSTTTYKVEYRSVGEWKKYSEKKQQTKKIIPLR